MCKFNLARISVNFYMFSKRNSELNSLGLYVFIELSGFSEIRTHTTNIKNEIRRHLRPIQPTYFSVGYPVLIFQEEIDSAATLSPRPTLHSVRLLSLVLLVSLFLLILYLKFLIKKLILVVQKLLYK